MIAVAITAVGVLVMGFVLGWMLCERAQQNVMSASKAVSDMALLASRNAATYEITLRNASTRAESVERKIDEMAVSVSACDRSNGAILHGLINASILKARATTPGSASGAPPLAESKGAER